MQFIAKRLFSNKNQSNASATAPATLVATLSVMLSVFVMLIASGIVLGYQKEVEQKIVGFSAHLKLLNIHALQVPEAYPIYLPPYLEQKIKDIPGVAHIQKVSSKKGVIKTFDQCSPITLKGITTQHDTTFLHNALVEGRLPSLDTLSSSSEILISRQKAKELNLEVGSRIYAYFFEQSIKTRRFTISGIYETHLKNFDETHVITHAKTVNQLNKWAQNQYGEIEIILQEGEDANNVKQQALHALAAFPNISVLTANELYPQVFSWLNMLNLNAWVVLVLMLGVAIFTMISSTFILILEQTQTIGTLSALGATQQQLQRLFFAIALKIALRGLCFGNIIALVTSFVIKHTNWFALDPATYYLDHVPMLISWSSWILINVVSLLIIHAALLVPTSIVAYIQPSKVIRFE